ncbi:hypothetical protein M422DRAFT_265623 [Sphaerobolus stellatus SS14]|uniref:Uncharacterized protein n=1 Tax=Sphaerobolus stellatus (strain SS14) TaxID=990650 RepID=A0A0C9UTM8_SPHS4|nr:hypothetical protein M422DRAFT_265623 [Sphaerobolus stellatus SS14]
MGWNRDEQPYTIPPVGPTKQELNDFVMGQTSGPTANNFRLDLRKLSKDHEERNLQKRWNNCASVVIAREFLRLCEGNLWGYTMDSQRESFLAERFADKLRRLKYIHHLQLRLSVAIEQDCYHILKEQQDGQKPDQHWAHCVERLLEFHKDIPSAYMDVLLRLSVNGMSSKDTDPESRVKPYRFYRIPKNTPVMTNLQLPAHMLAWKTSVEVDHMEDVPASNLRRTVLGFEADKKIDQLAPKFSFDDPFEEEEDHLSKVSFEFSAWQC